MAKHLCHVEVEGPSAVGLLEGEMRVAGGLADHIHRCTLTLGYGTDVVEMLFLNEQSHTLLTLVGNDFFCRKSGVADGQFGHVYETATLFDEFREAIDVAGRAVVVDRHNRVGLFFAKRTHQIVGTFLHFGIGALHGIELDAARIATGVDARH